MIKKDSPMEVKALEYLGEYTEIGKAEFLDEIRIQPPPLIVTSGHRSMWELGDTFSIPSSKQELLYFLCKEFRVGTRFDIKNYCPVAYFLLVIVENNNTGTRTVKRLYLKEPCRHVKEYIDVNGEIVDTGRIIGAHNTLAKSMRALGNNQYACLEMLMGKTLTVDDFIEGQTASWNSYSHEQEIQKVRIPQFTTTTGIYKHEIGDEYVKEWNRLRERDVVQFILDKEKEKPRRKVKLMSTVTMFDFSNVEDYFQALRDDIMSQAHTYKKETNVVFDPITDKSPRTVYIAKEPIKVYKILRRKIPNRYNGYREGELRSFDNADEFKAYTINSLCSMDLSLNKIFYEWDNLSRQEIEKTRDVGITSLLSMPTEISSSSWYKTFLYECTIPKDSEYCFMDDKNHLISNKIILNKMIKEV